MITPQQEKFSFADSQSAGRDRKKPVMTANILGITLGDWIPMRPLGKNSAGASVWDMRCRYCHGRANVTVRALNGHNVSRCPCQTGGRRSLIVPTLVHVFTNTEIQAILAKPTPGRLRGEQMDPVKQVDPVPESGPELAPAPDRVPISVLSGYTLIPNKIVRQIILAADVTDLMEIRMAVLNLVYPDHGS